MTRRRKLASGAKVCPTIQRRRFASILPMLSDQLDAPLSQLRAQGIAIVAPVGDEANQLLPRTTGAMPTPYTVRRQAGTHLPEQVSVEFIFHPGKANWAGLESQAASNLNRTNLLPRGS